MQHCVSAQRINAARCISAAGCGTAAWCSTVQYHRISFGRDAAVKHGTAARCSSRERCSSGARCSTVQRQDVAMQHDAAVEHGTAARCSNATRYSITLQLLHFAMLELNLVHELYTIWLGHVITSTVMLFSVVERRWLL